MQEMIVKKENILIPMVTEDFTDEDWMMITDGWMKVTVLLNRRQVGASAS